jgi:hypothetical protein
MRNAITGLVRGYVDLARYQPLIQRNRSILTRLLPALRAGAADTDLILFHEGNIPPAHQAFINQASGATFRFVDLRRTAPATGFDPARVCANVIPEMRGFGAGYRHMCHFWFVDFIDYLAGYRFVARIDEDCVIHEFPDLFTEMAAEGVVFTSAGVITDSPEAVVGMTEFSRFFKVSRREPLQGVPLDKTGPMTNLMALDLAYFRAHPAYRDYRRAVTRSGMIYSHRWGDLPLWGEFLAMYVPVQQVRLQSRAISYFHGSHSALINLPVGEATWLRELHNIALGKPATASPGLPGWAGQPAAVVNGQATGRFAFHTDRTAYPYWEVDLQSEQPLKAVRVFNRGDACQERALGLQVEVSTDGRSFTTVRVLTERFGGLHDRSPALIDLRESTPPVQARYVRLSLPREDYLHLDQVEVFA